MGYRYLHGDHGDPCLHFECWSLFNFPIETSLWPLAVIIPMYLILLYILIYIAPYDRFEVDYNIVPEDEESQL